MHSTFRRAGPLACSGAVVFGGPAIAAGTQADAQRIPIGQPLAEPAPGVAALAKVRSRLTEVAGTNELADAQVDETPWQDAEGTAWLAHRRDRLAGRRRDRLAGRRRDRLAGRRRDRLAGRRQPGVLPRARADGWYSTFGSRGAYGLVVAPS